MKIAEIPPLVMVGAGLMLGGLFWFLIASSGSFGNPAGDGTQKMAANERLAEEGRRLSSGRGGTGSLPPSARSAAIHYLDAVRARFLQEDEEWSLAGSSAQDMSIGVGGSGEDDQQVQMETDRLRNDEEEAEAELGYFEQDLGRLATNLQAHVAKLERLRAGSRKATEMVDVAKAGGGDLQACIKRQSAAALAYKAALDRGLPDL